MEDDGDVDIYSDVGEVCDGDKHDTEDLLTADSTELDLLDTSVIPRQGTPVKKNDRPPLITKKPEVPSVSGNPPTAKGSVVHDSSANTRNKPAQPSNAAKTIAALKKENGILRHNISVLYMTAKHLLDSKDKEITNLQRRLDNVVFRRNQGTQDNPHCSPTVRGVPRRRSRSPRNHPLQPSGAAQSSKATQLQEQSHSLQQPVETKPRVDMSEDLQRLYDYNGVKPRHRTEFSKVPLLALAPCNKETTPPGRMTTSPAEPVRSGYGTRLGRVPRVPLTPRKREIASFGGMASPTKSAAQRNARRIVKNSIKKVVASPTKRPRRLELHRTLPLKGRRLAEREQALLPYKGINRRPDRMATPRTRLKGQETSSGPNKPLDKDPSFEHSISGHRGSPVGSKRILQPSFEDRSPPRSPPGHNSEHGTRNLADFHHIPLKRRRSLSRSLSRSPPPGPCSPRDHLPPSRRSLLDRADLNHARRRSPRLRCRSPEQQYSSPEARGPRQRSQERRSPVPHRHRQLERSLHSPSPPPRLSETLRRPLSPGQRPRSPYHGDKGFGYLSSPPRHSRDFQREPSPGRRSRSPYREDKGFGQLPSPPRLSRTSQRLVSPGQRPASPCREGKGLGQLPSPPRLSRTSQRLGSPGRRPRSPYREDRGLVLSGSPPRISGIPHRHHSPGRRPRSPYDRSTDIAHLASPPRSLGVSRRQHSPDRRPRSPCNGDVGLRHSSPPPQQLGISRRQQSPGRRPRSPYDGDTSIAHSASPPQQVRISRRHHSPGRWPRSPCDEDKGVRHSRTSQRQLSPVRRLKSPCGVDKSMVLCPAGKTLAKKPAKTTRVALSSIVVAVGNVGKQENDMDAAKPHEVRVLEEGELSDSD